MTLRRLFAVSVFIGITTLSAPARAAEEEVAPLEKPGSTLFDVDEDLKEIDAPATAPTTLPTAEPNAGVDLLSLTDPSKAPSSGTWKKNDKGELVSPTDLRAWIEIPYDVGREYDFVIEFTRDGNSETGQILSVGSKKFAWIIGGKDGKRSCVSTINGRSWGNRTDVSTAGLLDEPGKRHRSVVSVRKEMLTVSLDGKVLGRWKTKFKIFTPSPSFPGQSAGRLGVGSKSSTTVFHRIEVIEVGERDVVATSSTQPVASNEPAPILPLPGGHGLRAELYAGRNFKRLVKTRCDDAIDFNWSKGTADTDVPADNFSIRWTGFVRAQTPGRHKLITSSDDGIKVWLDDKLVIESGGGRREVSVELGKKSQALRVEYYDTGGPASVSLRWQAPGATTPIVVPPEAFWLDRATADSAAVGRKAPRAAPPKGTGVNVEVFEGNKLEGQSILKRIDRQIRWFGEECAFGPGLPSDHFSVRYTTWLMAPAPGQYRLIVGSNDGIRLRLDGKTVIDELKRGSFRSEAVVELTNKPHNLLLDYYDDDGAGHVGLRWEQFNGFKEQLVPPEVLFTDKAEALRSR